MNVRSLHSWYLTYEEAVAVQNRLAQEVHARPLPEPVKTVAGADASYFSGSRQVHGAVLVFSFPDLTLIDQASAVHTMSFPYIPGLLSFREAPALIKAFKKIKTNPQVILFDGQGTAHPRGLGLASHMGLILDRPTIGCAKTRLVGHHPPVAQAKGSTAPLINGGKTVGKVVRTRTRVKPVFVSTGHAITLAEAVSLVLACCKKYRLPEPIRQAHLAVNRYRREKEKG
jgi:deoxyribonuclease V